jgi:hypothetical protein
MRDNVWLASTIRFAAPASATMTRAYDNGLSAALPRGSQAQAVTNAQSLRRT